MRIHVVFLILASLLTLCLVGLLFKIRFLHFDDTLPTGAQRARFYRIRLVP